MKEAETIDFGLARPNTLISIRDELVKLGVATGMTLIVHSSLSSLGWVCGGAVAVILALEESIGENGTLVMPAHSSDLTEPSNWHEPGVPETWWQQIRDSMPAFQVDLTPTREMGLIPETFRKQPGVVRSNHPNCSFAAWGKNKDFVTENHLPGFSMGPQSPLGKIHQLDGYILLLGVDHDRNSSLHLAEYTTEYTGKAIVQNYAPVIINNRREWIEYPDINVNAGDFVQIGKAFESTGKCTTGRVGSAEARLMNQRELVRFASAWMIKNRK
jgi:aminoglycoside 3-N-acetyltransferase